ncbi:parafibromin [Angomonas deanei]|uniref:Uncharacterized protein n=1 Tax=Angomonas deanei TaxID=59799 RepID=A0A7G2C2J8_9TRYP|nr:parafibromin [Angomonas deanei]CAD2212927.1 hypothetical protein, conserved [Angomonas deanei]|eukprot:EPY29167.1 parafibromin [Angomonas deanei]
MLIDDPEKFLSEHNNNHNNNNTAPQWSHVCACMTTGKESQFASWFPEEVRRRSASQLHHQKKKNKRRRGEGNEEEGTAQWILSINRLPTDKRTCRPSLLFSLIKGFLPYFEEDKVPPAVGEWRVEPLKLSRSTLRQYSHVAAASTLWEQLYTFLDHHPFFKEYTVPEKRTA